MWCVERRNIWENIFWVLDYVMYCIKLGNLYDSIYLTC